MKVIGLAIDQGYVSVRRIAGLFDLDIEDLADLFKTHDVPCAIDL